MHVCLLIIEMLVNLITMIENISCKPTNLPKIKMRRGLEHVCYSARMWTDFRVRVNGLE